MRIMIAATAAMLLAGAADAQPLTNAEARPAAEPVRETLFGQEIDDPYRWMENADRASDVASFIRASSAHTVAQLAALPGRNRVRDRISAAVQAGVRYSDLQEAGGSLFYRRTDPAAQLAKLVVRTGDGRERLLYDPEAGGTLGPAITGYSVSPDGGVVALNTVSAGDEVGFVRFIDVATGNILPDRLEPVWSEDRAVWLDARSLAYTRLPPRADGINQLENNRLFVHRLGRGGGDPLLGAGVDGAPPFLPREIPSARSDHSGDWLLATGNTARADSRVFVARRADVAAGRPTWRTIGDYADQIAATSVLDNRLFILSTKGAPNGAVLSLDLAAGGDIASAATVMPAGDTVLANIVATTRGLYVLGQIDGLSRLFFLAGGRGSPVELALPIQGVVTRLAATSDGAAVTFSMQDWFTAPRWFRAQDAAVTALGLDSASYAGIAGATQVREVATSADGTRVPLAILLPAGAQGGRPRPLLLEGYGSYGANTAEPYYANYMFGLLEEGGVVAYCGTRGGGERGRAWHEGGRSANKPNAHADLIACGERLVELGLTRPELMTVSGASAGGLLAPPAALKRPDLFGGLIAAVAVLNPTRLAGTENGPAQYGEMGDPTTEEGYRTMLLSDSYHMLATARDMPDTLLILGLNDRRVAPWMSAKFAARALDRFGTRRLALIRTDPEAGHGIGSAREQLVAQFADMFAFVLSQAGAEGFTTP